MALRIAFIASMVDPNFTPVFDELERRNECELLVLYETKLEPNRRWSPIPGDYSHVFLDSTTVDLRRFHEDAFVHIARGTSSILKDFNPDLVIARGSEPWSSPANVSTTNSLPNDQCDAAILAADALALNQRPPVSAMSLPSKMTAYFATGRPVLVAVASESAAASFVRSSRARVIIDPPDIRRPPAESIAELHRVPQESQDRFGSNGRNFSRATLANSKILPRNHGFISRTCHDC